MDRPATAPKQGTHRSCEPLQGCGIGTRRHRNAATTTTISCITKTRATMPQCHTTCGDTAAQSSRQPAIRHPPTAHPHARATPGHTRHRGLQPRPLTAFHCAQLLVAAAPCSCSGSSTAQRHAAPQTDPTASAPQATDLKNNQSHTTAPPGQDWAIFAFFPSPTTAVVDTASVVGKPLAWLLAACSRMCRSVCGLAQRKECHFAQCNPAMRGVHQESPTHGGSMQRCMSRDR